MQNAGHDAAAAALLALSPGPARQAEKESRSPQTAVSRLAHWGGTGEKGEIWIANANETAGVSKDMQIVLILGHGKESEMGKDTCFFSLRAMFGWFC